MRLSFSQRNGLAEIPARLKLGQLSDLFRNQLWKIIYDELMAYRTYLPVYRRYTDKISKNWLYISQDFFLEILAVPADEFSSNINNISKTFKSLVLEFEYNEVFDFIEFIVSHPQCTDSFKKNIVHLFSLNLIAYSFDINSLSVIPIASEEEAKSLKLSLGHIKKSNFDGASTHLSNAGKYINERNYSDSIRESIHAVESVVCIITNEKNSTLSSALKKLEQYEVSLHPAFKEGLNKLYAYTSDERGIRHSSLNEETKVDEADALFMFGACASFCSYLISKMDHKKRL